MGDSRVALEFPETSLLFGSRGGLPPSDWPFRVVCFLSLRPGLPRALKGRRMEQATQGAAQEHLPRNRGRPVLLSIFPAHLHSTRGPPSSQGQQEKEMQKSHQAGGRVQALLEHRPPLPSGTETKTSSNPGYGVVCWEPETAGLRPHPRRQELDASRVPSPPLPASTTSPPLRPRGQRTH